MSILNLRGIDLLENNNLYTLNYLILNMVTQVKGLKFDPILREGVWNTKKGLFKLVLKNDDRLFILNDKEKLVGIIGGPSKGAGSIWFWKSLVHRGESDKKCLGEYRFEEILGRYVVTPYENGFICQEKQEFIHPLDYLLRYLD